MEKLIVLAALAAIVWKMATGRWPWESNDSARRQAMTRARKLLGVRPSAGRTEIIEAHKRLIAMVHPDRGGTNDQVHEANAARDLLLDTLPN
ncbi:MAG TPA: molecular chaperone DnaJ [Croceibacterium sp.]|jgi:hypothetical protein